MKKKLTVLLSLLCVVAMLLPITATALQPGDYAGEAMALRDDAFTNYIPNFSGTSFSGYTGPYTVGGFPLSNPTAMTIFNQLAYQFNILCHSSCADGDGDQWNYGGMYLNNNRGNVCLPKDHAVAVNYHAPQNGVIKISIDALKASTDKSDGVSGAKFAIFKNGEKIWPATSNTGDESGFFVFVHSSSAEYSFLNEAKAYQAFPTNLSVQQGDVISFALTRATDKGIFGYIMPHVSYTQYNGETYVHSESFCGIQGGGGYYAGYAPTESPAVYTLPLYDEASGTFGGKSDAGNVGRTSLTVEPGADTVIFFRSPIIATYTLTSPVFYTTKNIDVNATVYRADGTASTVAQKSYAAAATAFSPISGIALDRDDVVAIRFSASEKATVSFDATMSSTETVHATSRNGEAMKTLASGFALAPDIHLDAIGASLSGNISLHLYTYFNKDILTNATEYGLLVFPDGASNYEYNAAYALTNGTFVEKNGEYRYTIDGIAAKEMTDVIYARPYAKTANGIVYGELRTASVKSYGEGLCNTYRHSATDEGKALYKLACAMLNYGAEAQTYFAYKQNDLANAGLREHEKQITTGKYADMGGLSGTATLDDFSFLGASLILSDLPAVRVYFTALAGASINGVTVEASMQADLANKTSLTPEWSEAKNAYYVTLEGVPAAHMRTPLYFCITNGTNTSQILTYSAETYANHCQNGGYASLAVTEAMFAYADAAIAYANISGQPKDGIEITADALVDAIRTGTVQANGVYYVTDNAPLLFHSIDTLASYDAKNITVYINKPVAIRNTDEFSLSNLHLIATNTAMTALTLAQSSSVVLENVTVSGDAAVGIAVEELSDHLFFKNTDITGQIATGLSLPGCASEVYLTNSNIQATSIGIVDGSTGGAYIKENTITADEIGILIETAGSELRNNTVTSVNQAISIKNAKDILAALNTVTGSILCEDSDNVVILKNSATSLTATGNKHLYTVSNTLSGRLTLTGNNYMIADLNTEVAVTAEGNENQNGDDVTNVDARLPYGADEALLPHVDKDQFVHYERREHVRTENGAGASFISYVQTTIAQEDDVIIAPGVYTQNGKLSIDGVKNKTIYAFGVMVEQKNNLHQMLSVGNYTDNLTIVGLTMGFANQSCGQVYVLEKMGNNKLRVVTGAGMINEFGNTNTNYYNATGMGAQRQGTFYAYCDTGFNSIVKNSDGTMTMNVNSSVYNMIATGDILTCRANNGNTTAEIYDSGNVTFRDMVLYGNAAGFAFIEGRNSTATTYYRVADTTKSGALITKEEYDRYRALESQYGVSLEVYMDDDGNYRGSLPHIGSIDATHTTKCKEGSKAISCLFENMCDDGTNQNATHGRLHDIKDNGDGTTTITYKGNFSEYAYSILGGNTTPNAEGLCYPFAVGDRVYVYTSAGQLVCDTKALTVTTDGERMAIDWTKEDGVGKGCTTGTTPIRYVTVKTEDVNFAALNDYDLTANSWKKDNKVLIDNMSMASNGFLFDNTLVRNIRSRGLLIKASDATIKNCSLINIGMGAVAIHYEIYWGESGVTENLKVQNNLIQHTGYFTKYNQGNNKIYSPISIYGLSTGSADEDYLLYKNIEITGNHIVGHAEVDHAIYVNSAKNVKILNNYLGARKGYTMANDTSPAIYIFCANDVEISGNTFPTPQYDAFTRVNYDNASVIYGTDLGGMFYMDTASDNRPVFNGTSVTYQGNWDYGYMPTSSLSFTPYDYYNTANGWLMVSGKKLWDETFHQQYPSRRGYGGVGFTHDYRMAAQSYYNAALRYTAPDTGTINISLASFTLPPSSGDSSHPGYFAIFKNNEMIWPKGGNYSTGSTWYSITSTTSVTDLKNAIARELANINVTKGDKLYFIAKSTSIAENNWCGMAFDPSITGFFPAPAAESSTMALNSANWPLYTAPTQTGASFNGSFDGFRGKWTIGSMPVAGGTYTPYGAMFNNEQSILMPYGASNAWSNGGMYMPTGRLALVQNYATTFCYRAFWDGTVDLSINKLMADSDSSKVYGAKFAIFVNGQRVWPTTSNADDPNGYYIYTSGTTVLDAHAQVSFLEAAQAYEAFPTNLAVKAGDLIQFAMVHGGSEMGYCEPCVAYR